jgi:hypothetical protein
MLQNRELKSLIEDRGHTLELKRVTSQKEQEACMLPCIPERPKAFETDKPSGT